MQADAEHQQNDADLGKFIGDVLIRHETGRERTHHHAREEIADKRRNADPLSKRAKNKSQHKADDDRRNQRSIVMHAAF